MNSELTEQELMEVKAGMPAGVVPVEDSGELELSDLDNVYAGPNRAAMDGKVLEHPELYREKSIDELVEEQIKAEEIAAAQEEQKHTFGL